MLGKKILIADDEPKIIKFLSGFLQREGFQVFTATNGREVLTEVHWINPDLIILDVMMPKLDGFEVCRRVREESKVPIIFLTSKNEPLDKIMGLTLGSDDYLTKPFNSAELLLRIKAVLRRTIEIVNTDIDKDVIRVQDLIIDRRSMTIEVYGKEIELTNKEFNLLWILASKPNQVFTRDRLIYHIWTTEYSEDTGIVTTLVKRLREKMEPDPANPQFIKTVRGIGYKFGLKPS